MKKLIRLILVAMLCFMSVGCADTPEQTDYQDGKLKQYQNIFMRGDICK